MSYFELLLAAAALSMEAFAVSIAQGLGSQKLKYSQMISFALCFGGFQGMMPTIGYFLGKAFESYLTSAGHYIVLILLGYIGCSMILDSRSNKTEHQSVPLTAPLLLIQGIAVSIDAFAAGVSFAALPYMDIFTAASLTALTTFLCAVTGISFGEKLGMKTASRAMLAGGVILVGIGVKVFVGHVVFA